jgi:hypothetical protein
MSNPKNGKYKSGEPLVVHIEPPQNTSEGSEFLDDAIRMDELPLIYGKSIAAESVQSSL